MLRNARTRIPDLSIVRTKTSQFDTLYGILGEYCFAQWFLGEWESHSKKDTKGNIDFFNKVEIKTSAFPFSENLNLLVREDYALKRKPEFYVQTIIDLPKNGYSGPSAQLKCILAGYATSEEVDLAPSKDFGSKFGGKGGYKCKYISIKNLKPMDELKLILNQNVNESFQ